MKLFVILSRVPYPLEKGDKLRAYHQLKELHKRHEIFLCCLSDCGISEAAEKAIAEICTTYKIFHLKKWRIALNLIYGLFNGKPFQVMYFYQRNIQREISGLINSYQPDHIYCQLIRTAEYAKNEHLFPKTLDYQDAFSKGMDRREQKAAWPWKEIITMERRRLIAYENIIFEYFEAKTIISAEDRRFIYHPERKDIKVITNGIDTSFFKPVSNIEKKFDLVFIGNMSYPPNIETAEYIANEVLPLLLKEKPDTKVLIAGSSPHRRVLSLKKLQGLTVSGWIDDIREAYGSARIFFAPMQIGSGLQNKLLEAMAMEIPCITSPLANRSLQATHGLHLIVKQDAEAYAEAILQLLKDKKMQVELSKAGRVFVEERFSWEQSVAELEALMLAQNEALAV